MKFVYCAGNLNLKLSSGGAVQYNRLLNWSALPANIQDSEYEPDKRDPSRYLEDL